MVTRLNWAIPLPFTPQYRSWQACTMSSCSIAMASCGLGLGRLTALSKWSLGCLSFLERECSLSQILLDERGLNMQRRSGNLVSLKSNQNKCTAPVIQQLDTWGKKQPLRRSTSSDRLVSRRSLTKLGLLVEVQKMMKASQMASIWAHLTSSITSLTPKSKLW